MNSLLSAPGKSGHDVSALIRTRGIAGLPAVAVLLFSLFCTPLLTRAQTWVSNLTGITGPTFVALDTRAGTTWLYVSEHGEVGDTNSGGRILKYNLTAGGAPTTIATNGTGDGQFKQPDAILVDAATGDLFIADRFLHRVQRITNTGTFVMKFGSPTVGAADEMHGPLGLARDNTGAIYITEHGVPAENNGNVIAKYTISGNTATRVWRIPGGFSTPYGIAVSGDRLYISDGFNNRVQRWDFEGNAQGIFPIAAGIIPLGIFADSNGDLWIAEADGNYTTAGTVQRITKRDTTGASLGLSWGSQGTGNGQFQLPFHVVVDETANRAYVSDYANNRVQVFDLGTIAPPVITSPLTASVTAGASFSYTITATNGANSFNATGLPAGLSVNTGTGVISGTTSVVGSHNVTIEATNSAGVDSETLVLTVQALPAAPAINSALTASVEAGAAFNYTITATNSPTSFSASGLPAGLSVNTSTGVISGSTTVTGSHNVTLGATNGGGTGNATLVLTVTPSVTPAPIINSALTANVEAGAAFNYTITATNSPTSFSASGLPAGLSVNTSTGAISGSTTVTGSHNVTLGATNAGGTGNATLVLTVTAAPVAPPVINSSLTASVQAGAAFNYTITGTNSPTSFSATGLPAGLAVDTSTGVISGATTVTGSHNVTLGATNAGGTGNATLVLTVTTAPVPPPIINSALTASIEAGAAFSYTITGTNSPTSFSAAGLPTGLSIDTSTGVISGSTIVTGSHNVTLGATNAGGTGNATLVLTVTAAPVAPPVINSALAASVQAGATFNYTITGTNSPTSFSAAGLPTGLSVDTSTGVISGSTTVTGSHNVTLGATNAGGTGNATLVLTVTAAPVSPPVVNSSLTASVQAGAAFNYTITGTNSPTSFSADNLPAGLSIDTSTGVISGSTTVTGSHNVTLGATNAGGTGNATLVLTVTAVPVPVAPVINSALTASVEEGAAFSYTITATNSPISFSADNLPAGLSVNASTGVISGSTTNIGTHSITLGATNAIGTGNATLTLTVNAVVPPPPPPDPEPQPEPQTITFLSPVSTMFVGQPITLGATASSGLPVTYTIVSGNGAIDDGVLTAHGVGEIVVRAAQAGNSSYLATQTETTFAVQRPAGQQVYFGKLGNADFAAAISVDSRTGLMVVKHPVTGEALIVKLAFKIDGTFANLATSVGGDAAANTTTGPNTAAATAPRTFTGRLLDGTLSGEIVELGTTFSGALQPSTGVTSDLAGSYTANAVGSASGDTYVVVGPNGQAYVLVATPNSVSAGLGSIAENGTFSVQTAPDVTVVGSAINGGVRGTLRLGDRTAALAGVAADVQRDDRLINVSSRLRVSAGDSSRSFIAGFVITGNTNKQILIRGVGPGLTPLGVTNAMPNPRIEVYDSTGARIYENDDWGGAQTLVDAANRTGAFALAAGSTDAALIATLRPGPYTVQLIPAGGSGDGLIEIYDMNNIDERTEQPLINISSRGFVDVGDAARLTAGFVVLGNAPKRVLIRGVGPTLTPLGVAGALQDPRLVVQAQDGALIAQNDDWGTPQALENQLAANAPEISGTATVVGAFALPDGSKDAALIVTLMPGIYTASVTGAGNTTGAALVEVYEVPNQ